MSLFGALSASLTNLTAQSSSVNVISNNIANLNTRGFKNSEASFSTLVTGATGGGVLQRVRQDIGSQGAVQSTNVGTDLAVQGRGFFVVKDVAGNSYYTRAGSFRTDATGNLVNEANYILQGWPLDSKGQLPGEGDNADTRANSDIASLEAVSTSKIAGKGTPTSTITTKINLNSNEVLLQGAGDATAFPDNSSNESIGASAIIVPTVSSSTTVEGANDTTAFPSSSSNSGISSTTLIVPSGTLSSGHSLSVTKSIPSTALSTYTYGGFATSNTLSSGSPVFGATSSSGTFSSLTNGNSFTIATTGTVTSAVTFTYQSASPSASAHEFNSLDTLAAAINTVTGLNARVVDDTLYVAPTDANEGITFTNVAGGIPAGLGLTGTSASTNRFATLDNLADLVNATSGLTATIASASSNATVNISNNNFFDSLSFSGSTAGLLTELGLSSSEIPSVYNFLPGRTISIKTNDDQTTSGTYTYGGFVTSDNLAVDSAFGAASSSAAFTGLTDGETFTISTSSTLTTPVTFTYKTSATTSARQFSSLDDLAAAINSVTGLTARVVNNTLFVAPADANEGITFTNGTSNTNNIVTGLGLYDTTSSTNRFASLDNIKTLVNDTTGLSASIASATSNATLTVYNDDPTDTIHFESTDADLLTELGLTSTQIDAVYAPDDTNGGRSIASGNISADFSRTITIYNSLGAGIDLRLAFVKLGSNRWGVELFAADPTKVGAELPDGLLAHGEVSFNGDGTLNSVSSGLSGDITIPAFDDYTQQTINLGLGTAGAIGTGLADGLSQFAGSYIVDSALQDGAPTGRLQSLQIDSQGYVTAIFDNSLTQRVYKLPLAYVANPNGLQAESGNAYSATRAAGDPTLGQVGNPSVGTIVPGALEVSNSDLGSELTKMITTQQAYSASANVIRKINDLFDELKNL